MYIDTRRSRYADYFDWQEGVLDTLFTGLEPTFINGLKIVKPNQISTRFNYFSAVSQFFADAMMADVPNLSAPAHNLLQDLTDHWSVTGEGIVVAGQNGLRAVRPDYVYPIMDEYDKEIVRRYVFVYPQRAQPSGATAAAVGGSESSFTAGQPVTGVAPDFRNSSPYANKARVIDYDIATGLATDDIRDYRWGYVADTPATEPRPFGPVYWINTGDGKYHDMEGLVREINIRLNVNQLSLNASAYPMLQIDIDQIAGGRLTGGVTNDKLNENVDTGLGLLINPPFSGEEGAAWIERSGTSQSEALEYMRLLLGQLGVISGVPDYVFGVQLGRPANETERVLFTGQAKVNRFRRDIEQLFSELGIDIKFGTEPFVTRGERLGAVIREVEAGIIQINEARAALGYAALSAGNRFIEFARRAVQGRRQQN